jgi:DNA-directed RNA polymerase specialized sigma24 family protein
MPRAPLNRVVGQLHNLVDREALRDATDGQLRERVRRGQDEAAFTLLVRRYGPTVLGVARRAAGNEQDAEDVFQATFLLLAQKAGSIRSDRFEVREQASRAPENVADLAEPRLRDVLLGRPAAQTRRRVEAILEKHAAAARPAEQLRMLRALEVLEYVGTADAREVLQDLAAGSPAAWQTREARACLRRLARRPVTP